MDRVSGDRTRAAATGLARNVTGRPVGAELRGTEYRVTEVTRLSYNGRIDGTWAGRVLGRNTAEATARWNNREMFGVAVHRVSGDRGDTSVLQGQDPRGCTCTAVSRSGGISR